LLPLPGTFHEVSLACGDVRASVEFYEKLGFRHASTTDAFAHRYGVLTDGRLVLGLHEREGRSPTLTFVRPNLAASIGAFERAGIQLTRCSTGEDVFNEIAFEDPCGHAVAVLEARTYSPVALRPGEGSLCGDFAELSLPARDFAAARAFWEPLGFVADELTHPYPRLALISDHLDLAFHSPQLAPTALLVFRAADPGARLARLRERGFALQPAPRLAGAEGALLPGPEGTPLLLTAEAAFRA